MNKQGARHPSLSGPRSDRLVSSVGLVDLGPFNIYWKSEVIRDIMGLPKPQVGAGIHVPFRLLLFDREGTIAFIGFTK